MIGEKYGRLTVVQSAERKNREDTWLCKCDCGNTTIATKSDLVRGHKKSCGCYKLERISQAKKTHGESDATLYHKWEGIKQRTLNESCKDYPNYGGRGITVCKEWAESFETFRDWALANGYRDNLTIDRKDTDGNYCPENCRWATPREQANNRRSNRTIEHNGESRTLKQWADIAGMSLEAFKYRMDSGWDMEKALTTPARGYKRKEK